MSGPIPLSLVARLSGHTASRIGLCVSCDSSFKEREVLMLSLSPAGDL